ncbi:uncharacterized protein TNCV_1130261 [Trichonephila clavipes]|nr:uncharacterized protein TNCV_1130261 [Trichonephila clavipes]
MKNAVKGRSKTDLTYLYDALEGKLRALESLGRTQEKYGDFLIPLVESCLPEETLLAWERSRNHESTQNTRSLEHLMNFLRKEVQGEEMVQLARTGFGPQHNFRKNDAPVECVIQSELATASVLVSLDAGNVVTLHSGLTAVESKLGWTVFGKQKFCGKDKFTTTLSMHVGNIPLQNLWELEVLGITDPTETVKEREDLSDFREKMKILPEGRYEVELPWKSNLMNLCDNKELAWKRQEKMINKLKCGNFFDDYQNVFSE